MFNLMTSPPVRSGTKRERTRDHLLMSAQAILMDAGVAGLAMRQITTHAGLVSATFYNYFPDIGSLVAELGELLGATHAAAVADLNTEGDDPEVRFARITRHTMRILTLRPGFGRLLFDVGLPADRLSSDIRLSLKRDIADGMERGIFKRGDLDVTVSLVTGALYGLALDLHRGVLPACKIEAATASLLTHLGVCPAEALALSQEMIEFPTPPNLPMRWLALPPRPAAE